MANIPSYYSSGSRLSLQFATGVASVTVVEPFTPFTMSQVLLVLMNNLPIVVKVYDPRFLDHRKASRRSLARPWNFDIEIETIRRTTPDPNFEFALHPGDDDRVGWEIWYYQQMECAFRNEVESYKRLHQLQGHGVPLCLGSGTLNLPGRALSPHVLLLEYIPDAISLQNIIVRPDQSVIASLLRTVNAFAAMDVSHNDINSSNVIFSPSNYPTRAVIIDFGHSYLRDDELDEDWEGIVCQSDDVGYLKRRLARKGWKVDA